MSTIEYKYRRDILPSSEYIFGETKVILKDKSKHIKYKKLIQHKCKQCGKIRWISLYSMKNLNFTNLCIDCSRKRQNYHRASGPDSPVWKGGKHYRGSGKHIYATVYVARDDPYFPMATETSKHGGGSVAEHRLVMAKHIGRCIKPEEVVHHINGNKKDNRIENLELLPNKLNHLPYNLLQKQMQKLKEVNEKLIIENKELKAKLKSMKEDYIETGGVLNDSSEDTQI